MISKVNSIHNGLLRKEDKDSFNTLKLTNTVLMTYIAIKVIVKAIISKN